MDYEAIESSQRQHHQDIIHQENLNLIIAKQEILLFTELKPKITIDGNQYCVLYGNDLQSGIAGFGDTIYNAIIDFNKQFHKQLK